MPAHLSDLHERKQLEEVVKRSKADLEAMAARQQQVREREVELAIQVRTEQSKLAELSDGVNQIERALDSAPGQLSGAR